MQTAEQTAGQAVQEAVTEGSLDRLAWRWQLSDERGRRIVRILRRYLGTTAIGTVSGIEALVGRDVFRALSDQLDRDMQTSDAEGWWLMQCEFLDALEADRRTANQNAAQAAKEAE